MNYPQDAEELLHWDTFRKKDTFGWFTVITGFEGTGKCFWCGEKITGRRRYCGHKKGCYTQYQRHFAWSFAKSWCLRRYEYRCANCGREAVILHNEMTNLRAHHIIPLNGASREVSVFNIHWNLICLCHDCHILTHAVMREEKTSKVLDIFELAKAKGQGVLNLVGGHLD